VCAYPRVEINWHRVEDPKNRPKEGLSGPSEGIFGHFFKSVDFDSAPLLRKRRVQCVRVSALLRSHYPNRHLRGLRSAFCVLSKLAPLALNIELKDWAK
jgi:hypothetical protein